MEYMSENSYPEKANFRKAFTPYKVWGLLMVLTIIYGFIIAIVHNGNVGGGFVDVFEGLWGILTNPAVLTNDYIALYGVGAALVNSGLCGLLVLLAFNLAKLPGSGLQMGAIGLTMGFALLGKNPLNMLPVLLGGFLFSAFHKKPDETFRESYRKHVTVSVLATCLAPIVSQPAFIPEITNAISVAGAIALGTLFGVLISFVICSLYAFSTKRNEGLNLYAVGWLAGFVAIAFTVIYQMVGIESFGPSDNNMWNVGPGSGAYNWELYSYLGGVIVYFFVVGILAGGLSAYKFKNLKQSLYLKAADSKYENNYYQKYGQAPVYIAMAILGLFALVVTLSFGVVHLNGLILGAIISMIGWGGFGKAVANAVSIIAGVLLGAVIMYFAHPSFFQDGMGFVNFMSEGSTASAVWSSAFWGTCLSPMARFFGWRWAIPVGVLHFAFAITIASFHWGQNLYNNGLSAGLVCIVMIPFIRAFDRKGKYSRDKVYDQ